MNDQPLIHQEGRTAASVAAQFRAMADKVELNGDASFGGAYVIIPPLNGGDPIATLILDDNQNPAQFYAMLKTKAEMALEAVDQAVRNQSAFGGRR